MLLFAGVLSRVVIDVVVLVLFVDGCSVVGGVVVVVVAVLVVGGVVIGVGVVVGGIGVAVFVHLLPLLLMCCSYSLLCV